MRTIAACATYSSVQGEATHGTQNRVRRASCKLYVAQQVRLKWSSSAAGGGHHVTSTVQAVGICIDLWHDRPNGIGISAATRAEHIDQSIRGRGARRRGCLGPKDARWQGYRRWLIRAVINPRGPITAERSRESEIRFGISRIS